MGVTSKVRLLRSSLYLLHTSPPPPSECRQNKAVEINGVIEDGRNLGSLATIWREWVRSGTPISDYHMNENEASVVSDRVYFWGSTFAQQGILLYYRSVGTLATTQITEAWLKEGVRKRRPSEIFVDSPTATLQS